MSITYVLSWGSPHERLFDISIRFVAPVDDPLLWLPAWRPGRYLIQNFAANVREWSANMRKIAKSSWRVDARAGEEVTVTYRYYAGVLDAGSSYLEEDGAYFNGSNLLMCVDDLRFTPATLTVAVPGDWNIETQLPRDDDGRFQARDYDHLIDSPTIAAAQMTRHSFVEGGARVHLVFRHDHGIDTEQFVEPLRELVRAQAAFFGGMPCREYRFLYHVGDRWHGVEHEDSCSIIARRASLLGSRPGDEGHDHLLSISSHELFHVWNVKRIVPECFRPYDYSTETPTRLLWAMEGVTSYYADLMLRRAGLWSEERYLHHLAEEIETLESSPGRLHLSLAQASFDGWLEEPARMHDKSNCWISFYNKGELVAALLDLTIRKVTDGAKSLDDVMRILWEEYGAAERGLEEDAVERATARVADVGDFFARYVDGTDALPYAELFAAAGVAFDLKPRGNGRPSFGARLRSSEGRLVVDSVVRGGSAMEGGLLPNDELIAIDGTRVGSAADVERAMRALGDGGAAEGLIARGGVMRSVTLAARPDPRVHVTLRAEGESPLRDQWLRRME